MGKKPTGRKRRARRQYSAELRGEAVQMLLDGHSAESVVRNLGLSGTSLLYRWKSKLLEDSGPAATALDSRVHQLEEELRRVERERDILKKALAIFSQRT
jgi:transposase